MSEIERAGDRRRECEWAVMGRREQGGRTDGRLGERKEWERKERKKEREKERARLNAKVKWCQIEWSARFNVLCANTMRIKFFFSLISVWLMCFSFWPRVSRFYFIYFVLFFTTTTAAVATFLHSSSSPTNCFVSNAGKIKCCSYFVCIVFYGLFVFILPNAILTKCVCCVRESLAVIQYIRYVQFHGSNSNWFLDVACTLKSVKQYTHKNTSLEDLTRVRQCEGRKGESARCARERERESEYYAYRTPSPPNNE